MTTIDQKIAQLIEEVLKLNKPTVIVLMAGSSVDLSEYEDRANAVLLGWYPGEMGGKAITDILFGVCLALAFILGIIAIVFNSHDLSLSL